MENKITPEMIEQAKKAQSVEELLALAKENKVILTAERAQKLFDQWHENRELSDDELDSVSGGCDLLPYHPCPACGEMVRERGVRGEFDAEYGCQNVNCRLYKVPIPG